MNKFAIINFVLFQLVWFICAFLTEYASRLVIPVIALHFCIVKNKRRDIKVLHLDAVGILFDFLMFQFGVLAFQEDFFPAWLCALWFMFVLSLNYSFEWARKLNIIIQSILGAIFGPMSYFAAFKLGAIEIGVQQNFFLMAYSLGWAFIFPFLIYLNTKPYYKAS